MKKYFSTGIVAMMVYLCMCYLSISLVAADSWAESVEYYADEAETYEEYWTDEDESDEWDEAYDEEEYYSDDEIFDDGEEVDSDLENDDENEDSFEGSEAEVLDAFIIEDTVSSAEDVLSTAEEVMLEEDVIASGTCGETATWTLTWEENDLTLTISGSGDMSNFSQVSSAENSIPWVSKKSKIKTVIVEEGITGIGTYSFYSLNEVTDVTLPNTLSSLGKSSFAECSSINCFSIPDNVTHIGDSAFSGCSNLADINIPNSVTSIGNFTFSGCSSLSSITIPNSVTSIGNSSFSGCSSLASINIPDSVTNIGDSAFYDCSSLSSITIPGGVTSIGKCEFLGCNSLSSITIPNSVTSIGRAAFHECSSLAEITIPDGVTSIGDLTFCGCRSLASITIPNSVTSIEKQAFSGCSNLISVTLPDSIDSIRGYVFKGCSSLVNVTIPDSVKTIYVEAFSGCSSLTNIIIPDSVEKINMQVFMGCESLTSIFIPDSVSGIGADVFSGCSQLTIFGMIGSRAAIYANNNGIPFISTGGTVSKVKVSGIETRIYTGEPLTQSLTVYYLNGTLNPETDYSVTYENNINPGTATVTITGKGNYTDTITKTFTIKPASVNDAVITNVVSKTYTGSELTQSPVVQLDGKTLTLDTDYYLAYKNNINSGKATIAVKGMGNYSGVAVAYFTVQPASVKNATITGITPKVYTGSALTQSPVVKLGGKTLTLNTDYSLAYMNNINVGKATITAKGKGNYSGEAVACFTIEPASVKNATITGITSKVYTGSALTQSPVVKLGEKTLKLDKDYYLAYKNNTNPGRATIAIKGKGNYNNVAVKYFAINPKPSWVDKLTTPKTKQIKITWGKRTQISGYQLEISTKKDFSSSKMQKNVYDPAKLSMTVTVAKANTTYYVRIRSFKKTSDKTYFSTWSAVKTIKTI